MPSVAKKLAIVPKDEPPPLAEESAAAEARSALERLIGQATDWSRLDQFLISYVVEPALAPTVFASSFASALELVREGLAEIHQKESFAPIYMRKRVGANGVVSTHDAQENA